jgi:hypothetical protein
MARANLGAGTPRPRRRPQVGVIGRRTELVLIPSGRGRMWIVSPHALRVAKHSAFYQESLAASASRAQNAFPQKRAAGDFRHVLLWAIAWERDELWRASR